MAVCMRESTFTELSRAFYNIKRHYGWVEEGQPREIHGVQVCDKASIPEQTSWLAGVSGCAEGNPEKTNRSHDGVDAWA